jgi:hypothetical protein
LLRSAAISSFSQEGLTIILKKCIHLAEYSRFALPSIYILAATRSNVCGSNTVAHARNQKGRNRAKVHTYFGPALPTTYQLVDHH